jgi:hypothetical protein
VTEAEARFGLARTSYLAAHAGFEAPEAVRDRAALKDHARRFRDDPDPRRSEPMRAHARRAIEAVDRFSRTEGFVVSDVAVALLGMQTRIAGLGLKALNAHFDQSALSLDRMVARINRIPGTEPIAPTDLEPQKAFERAGAIEIDLTARALEATARIVELNVGTVRLFLRKHVERDLRVVLEAIREIVRQDSRAATVEAIWEALKEAAPEIAAELEPAARAARLYGRLQEEVLKLHVPFRPPGPEDALLSLPGWLEAQVAALEAARALLGRGEAPVQEGG